MLLISTQTVYPASSAGLRGRVHTTECRHWPVRPVAVDRGLLTGPKFPRSTGVRALADSLVVLLLLLAGIEASELGDATVLALVGSLPSTARTPPQTMLNGSSNGARGRKGKSRLKKKKDFIFTYVCVSCCFYSLSFLFSHFLHTTDCPRGT